LGDGDLLAIISNKFPDDDRWGLILLALKYNISYYVSLLETQTLLFDLRYITNGESSGGEYLTAVAHKYRLPGFDKRAGDLLYHRKAPLPPSLGTKCTEALLAYVQGVTGCSVDECRWLVARGIPTAQARKYRLLFGDVRTFDRGTGGCRHWRRFYPYVYALWLAAPPGGTFRLFFGTDPVLFDRRWNHPPYLTRLDETLFEDSVRCAERALKSILLVGSPRSDNSWVHLNRETLGSRLGHVELEPVVARAFRGPFRHSTSVSWPGLLRCVGAAVTVGSEYYTRRVCAKVPKRETSREPIYPEFIKLSECVRYLSRLCVKFKSSELLQYWDTHSPTGTLIATAHVFKIETHWRRRVLFY
jgi:hypothetical protein